MPKSGVNIAILQDGKFQVTRWRDFEVWCLPDGEVGDGETLVEAARRKPQKEVHLETPGKVDVY